MARHSYYRPSRQHHHRASASSSASSSSSSSSTCWRNPFLVFFITFAVLGSLRFRVPNKASAAILHHRTAATAEKGETKGVAVPTASEDHTIAANNNSTSTVRTTMNVEYRQIEEQSQGFVYRKYKAFHPNTQLALTVQQWAELVTAEQHNVESTTTASALLSQVIREVPYQAVFFETPPVTSDTIQQQPFEFVLVDAPSLYRFADSRPDELAFAQQFNACKGEPACTFPNLGGDAILISPVPQKSKQPDEQKPETTTLSCYAHLAGFIRNAPSSQVSAVWRDAAAALLNRVGSSSIKVNNGKNENDLPVWFSTSGTGIAWLHFRLDSIPKYYTYEPYKKYQAVVKKTKDSNSDPTGLVATGSTVVDSAKER